MLSVQEYVFVFVFYLTIGMVLYSCSLELIYLALLELYAHWLATLHSYPSPAPGDTILLFESMNLLLSSSYKWKHALFVLLWLIYFTWHNIHLCSWSVFADYRISFFLKADIQLYIYIYIYIYILHFLYLVIYWRRHRFFIPAIVKNPVANVGMLIYFWSLNILKVLKEK